MAMTSAEVSIGLSEIPSRSHTSSHLAISRSHGDEQDGANARYGAKYYPFVLVVIGDEGESKNADDSDHVARNGVVCRRQLQLFLLLGLSKPSPLAQIQQRGQTLEKKQRREGMKPVYNYWTTKQERGSGCNRTGAGAEKGLTPCTTIGQPATKMRLGF